MRLFALLMILYLGASLCLKAQEKKGNLLLEQRLLVIEDYLKNRLYNIQKRLRSQEQTVKQLKKSNKYLQEQVAYLKNQLRLAENEVLRIKIEITALKKGGFAEENSKKLKKISPKIKKIYQYQNEAVRKCLIGLRSRESNIRMGSILKLAQIKHKESVKALIFALQDKDIYNKMLVCKALAQKRSIEAIPHILLYMRKSSMEFREVASTTLKEITGISPNFHFEDKEKLARSIDIWREKLKEKGIKIKIK